ncbi:MAG: DNA translocase FtsK [Bacillota bacterium]|jgi:DNA segregation ATPase FtsK/SpoIIIE-like protein|nr:DNA translocase FtsK [Bacillota bacterium]
MAEQVTKKVNKTDEIISVFIIAAAILLSFMFWAPSSMTGLLGKYFKQVGHGFFGTLAVVFPVILFVIGLDRIISKTRKVSQARKNCTVLLFLCAVVLISTVYLEPNTVFLATRSSGKSSVLKAISLFWQSGLKPELVSQSTIWSGGLIGGICGLSLNVLTGKTGSIIIISTMILALIVVVFNVSYTHYLQKSAEVLQQSRLRYEEKRRLKAERIAQAEAEQAENMDEFETESSYDVNATVLAESEEEQAEFGFDLSKNTSDKDPHEVSSEWIKRELAKEKNQPYEEPHQITYDLPDGSWTVDSTEEDFPTDDQSIDFNLPSFEIQDEGNNAISTSEPEFQFDQSNLRSNKTDDFNTDSSSSSDTDQSELEKSERHIVSEQDPTEERADQIEHADVEDIEDKGRAHWEDRAEDAVGAEIPQMKKQTKRKQIALTDKYITPPLDLLNSDPKNKKDLIDTAEIQSLGQRLEQTLTDFGVDAKVVNYTTGPTITRFELSPGPGVKVSRITNLSDDIALSLAAIGVRIEAPIPGKPAIGIEIPNKETEPVLLRGIIESEAFKKAESNLTAGIGRDIQGNEILCDLEKMPHLLIAGATGSGKSVCINAIIISLIYRTGPADLKMIMIDPKVVELNVYNGIPHLLQPVVTDPKKAFGALNWAVTEMEERYEKFAENSVRDFSAYNSLISSGQIEGEKLPSILIIIDELSDLMATTPTEVEDAIARLTAMARAAGIHLIIATQRPSVDVITGVIKANIPSRIAFTVASQVDSRTILDMGGAEKLLGKGDMLYYPQSASKPKRGQGGFVTDAEVERVIRYLKGIYETDYDESVAKAIENVGSGGSGPLGSMNRDSEEDELLADAIKMVIESEYASISLLQRRLSIGYPRAARLVDRLYDLNIIGPFEGSKPRKVLMTPEEYLASQEEESD